MICRFMEKINCDRFYPFQCPTPFKRQRRDVRRIKNLLEQPAVFGEKRTQKLSPGLIKDQQSLFYFFSHSLLSTMMTSILIQYGGHKQIFDTILNILEVPGVFLILIQFSYHFLKKNLKIWLKKMIKLTKPPYPHKFSSLISLQYSDYINHFVTILLCKKSTGRNHYWLNFPYIRNNDITIRS
jgi:hypothetical protein